MMTYRKHGRTLLKCAVKLEHDEIGEVVAETRDVSATGVFVKCKELVGKISVGDAFKAEVDADAANEIPSQLTVVRMTDEGVGFAYE